MSSSNTNAVLIDLLSDCEEAMTDPRPQMAHWGPYCRLIDFKLAMSVTDDERRLIDATLMPMRARLAALTLDWLALLQQRRLGKAGPPRLSPTDPPAQDVSVYRKKHGHSPVSYHGTVRGLLPPIYLRGLRPELRTDWRQSSQTQLPPLVANWREAEVHAVAGHLRGPSRRALAYWQPAVLRISMPPALSAPLCGSVSGDDAAPAGVRPVDGAEVWLLGEDPRPHWQPLIAVLSRRRATSRPRSLATRNAAAVQTHRARCVTDRSGWPPPRGRIA